MTKPQGRTLFSDELLAVGQALSPIKPQEHVTEIILRPAISSLGAVAGAVLLINIRGDRLELITRQGYAQDAVTIWQDGPLGRHVPAVDAIEQQEALFFEDPEALKRHYPQLEEETGAIAPVGSAVLPILLDGHALGVLVLDFKAPHDFTPAEKQFLSTLAFQCAVALDRSTQQARHVLQQEQQLEVLESISDAFYAVDDEWRFTYINPRAAELWGRSREELLGKVFWEEFPQAVGSELYHAHFQAARTREVVRLETVSPILGTWITLNIYPALTGLSVYFADISERKALEAQGEALTHLLERRVEERTRELQDLNAELRAYAIGISRDLTEPLRRVNAFIGLLERRLADQFDERIGTLFKQVREETRRVGERMDELRHLAVLERRELHEEPLALDQLIVQVRSDLEPQLKGRKVKWVIGTLPRVVGDALLLRQVFAELLSVALDATQETPGAVIEVDGEVRGGKVIVGIRHNGAKLKPDDAQSFFDVFRAPRTNIGVGDRIGLANARRIVRRHGGYVWVEEEKSDAPGVSLLLALPDRLGDLPSK